MNSLCFVTTLIILVIINIDSGDIMFLICRVTSCEPLFKGLCKFLAIGLVLVEI